MAQTVRAPAHYDRIRLPGDQQRSQSSPKSKTEYANGRRKSNVMPFRQDTLQYDFDFERTAAAHNRQTNANARRSEPVRSVSRAPGGRSQQQIRSLPSAQARIEPNGARRERTSLNEPIPFRARQQQKQQEKRPQRDNVTDFQSVRPKAPAVSNTNGQRKMAAVSNADGRRKASEPHAIAVANAGGQPKKAKSKAPRSSENVARQPKPRKVRQGAQKPPQIQQIKSAQQGKAAQQHERPAQKKTKKGDATKTGHGRKLTPTYDIREKRKSDPRSGAPIAEGGVVGYDMGYYSQDPASAPASAARRPLRARSLFSTILTILIVFVILFIVISGHAQISSYTHENTQIESNIASLEEEVSKLKMDVALQEDLGNIQERAADLGMIPPAEDQVEYVSLENTAEQTSSFAAASLAETPAEPGILENLMNWVAQLFQNQQ